MSEPIPAEVVLWQQLGKYLKTETEVSKPEIVPYPRRGGRPEPTEVVHLKVRFSNTASDEPGLPKIVFTGVGLGIVRLPDRHAGSMSEPIWASAGMKLERPARKLQSRIVIGAAGGGWSGSRRWEDLTGDESAHGVALFPGDSAAFELTIPVYDIGEYELHAQGSVSRRHFFHYDQIVNIAQT